MKQPREKTFNTSAICPSCQRPNLCALAEAANATECWCMKLEPIKNNQAPLDSSLTGKVCLCETCLQKYMV
ncbi:cysteine-rich CWC family protein [Simiduia litorea]|uniref:cysteine-rich CWC family protein n=1 Tax=Simiduia litorea TaxID=1435348 RepID=UPI0036F3C7EF